ncbi:MAG: NrfD/PsrC family molybdoenzyme membrane anchor subunit [Planctomycetota bacterium]
MSTNSRESQSMQRLAALFPKGALWWTLISLSSLVVLLGVYAYCVQWREGLMATGMRTIGDGGASWGLYVIFNVYFVGVSFSGIVIASLIRLFHIEDLKPLSRMAELVTLTALIIGTISILCDLGRVINGMYNFPAFGRVQSAFFGDFTMVTGGYFFASFVFFYLASRPDAMLCANYRRRLRWVYRLIAMGFSGRKTEFMRHHRVSFWLALSILPLLVTAHSTLGFVFGIQSGRPGWYSALQAPGFVVLAGASGIGILILVAAFMRRYLNLYSTIKDKAFYWLSNFMWILILVYLYFMGVEELTANYTGSIIERQVAHSDVDGAYAYVFWTVIACFVIPLALMFTQFLRKKVWLPGCLIAGAMVNVGAVLKRFIIVVPSQTHGTLLPYPVGVYHPTWVEYSIEAGLVALGLIMILVYIRFFPIIPVNTEPEFETESLPEEMNDRHTLRIFVFLLTFLAGIALMVVGLIGAARYGTKPFMDPIVPFGPMLFIVGILVTLGSAIAYEISPGSKVNPVAPTPPTPPSDPNSELPNSPPVAG